MTTCTPPTRSFTSRTFIGGLNRFVCFLRGWESKTNGFKFQSERAGALALCGRTTSRHPERREASAERVEGPRVGRQQQTAWELFTLVARLGGVALARKIGKPQESRMRSGPEDISCTN